MKLLRTIIFSLAGSADIRKKNKKPFGCKTADLENFDTDEKNCKPWKGIVTNDDGIELEGKNTNCRRTCSYTGVLTKRKIKCKCTREKVCTYQIKAGKLGWLDWKADNPKGKPYVKYDDCLPTTPEATTTPETVSEWNTWEPWSSCSATCGVGNRSRERTCPGVFCKGERIETLPCVDYQSASCGPDGRYYPFNWNFAHRFNEGDYCIFPTNGWFQGEMDGTNVKMTVECAGTDQFDALSHVIAGKGTTCELVCNADNGENYRPRSKTGSDNFVCTNPIPIQMYFDNCYRNPFLTEDEYHQQCVVDWIDQGFSLVDQTLTDPEMPWYFSKQTWPRSGCWPGCPGEESLEFKLADNDTNNCFKVEDTQCPTEFPPLTQAEIDAGASEDGMEWSCTDSNNPRSVCTKSCTNGHLALNGNFKKECICKENCQWESFDFYSVYIIYEREGSCLPACDAYPAALGNKEYRLTCEGYSEPSDSSSTDAIVYQWNQPTPVLVGNTCVVTCDKYGKTQFPGIAHYPVPDWWTGPEPDTDGQTSHSITCQENWQNNFEWDVQIPDCLPVCSSLLTSGASWTETQNGVQHEDILWECTKGNYVGSECYKTCPEGFKLEKKTKNVHQCRKTKYNTSWKKTVANCIPE